MLNGIRQFRLTLDRWERCVREGRDTNSGRAELEGLLVDRAEWDVLAHLADGDRGPQEDGEPVTEATASPPPCDREVFERGTLALMTHLNAKDMEAWVVGVREASGQRVDWHYSGGHACVLFLGDAERVRAAIEAKGPALAEAIQRDSQRWRHTYGLGARVGLGYNGMPDIVIGAG